MCVHDTDTRGYCVKNGLHCAFAHGNHDHRPPVYDIKEIQALEAAEVEGSSANGPNALDKERNLMNEDPKWQGMPTFLYKFVLQMKISFLKCNV